MLLFMAIVKHDKRVEHAADVRSLFAVAVVMIATSRRCYSPTIPSFLKKHLLDLRSLCRHPQLSLPAVSSLPPSLLWSRLPGYVVALVSSPTVLPVSYCV